MQEITTRTMEYEAPRGFVAVFYSALCVWTTVAAFYLGPRAFSGDWPLGSLFMMGFVVAFTWYFSVGIAYRVRLGERGTMELVSLRRTATLRAADIDRIEGPRLAILPVGFLRFRLGGERLYLFCRFESKELAGLLRGLKKANNRLTIKFLPA